MPSALTTTASTGLSRSLRLDRVPDRRGDLVGARDDRRDEEHDHGVDAGSRSRCGSAAAYVVGRRGAEQVDRVRDARLDAGSSSRERVARLGAELGQLEPGRVARVGAEDAEPAGVRDDADAASVRERLAREQRRGVDELLERARAQHAGLAEERLDGGVRAGERSGVRARRARAGAGRARLQREDRLAAARRGAASRANLRGLPNDSR